MPKEFIHENFLLDTPEAVELYHRYAADLPIYDYHNHLSPSQIADDVRFENLAQVWLAGDHYKWRLMRANGVPERYCTGDAPDREKFQKWAETIPQAVGNPLYHWTHLELARYFGIADLRLSPRTAAEIWDRTCALLAQPGYSARGLLRRMRVAVLCTTDDPADDLAAHRRLAGEPGVEFRMYPTFRPDAALQVDDPSGWVAWVGRLERATGETLRSWEDLLAALRRRARVFHELGGRLADHGLEAFPSVHDGRGSPERAWRALREGRRPDREDADAYRWELLLECGRIYADLGWVMQLHLGALRNVNTRLYRERGRDVGCDTIGDADWARPLSRFLDQLDREGRLPKTILYNLNPRDNELMAAMVGSFQDGSSPGKLQYGSAWWFLDTLPGIERQLEVVANFGLLGRFVGMLTDSRSLLSMVRHEYFRRILCSWLGRQIARGALPRDLDELGALVRRVAWFNAVEYFGMHVPGWARP